MQYSVLVVVVDPRGAAIDLLHLAHDTLYCASNSETFVDPVSAAAVTSVLSCVTSQPGDMVLSLMNAHKNDRRRTIDIVHDILKSERGAKGFFVGLKTRFLHVGIIVTLQLMLYDVIKRMCGIAATGMSH